jgi:hypothetical protein
VNLVLLLCILFAAAYWNYVTATDANRLERIRQEFTALCFKLSLPHVHYNYTNVLVQLKLHTYIKRGINMMYSSLFEFTLVTNSVWKLLVFGFLLRI